VVIIVVVDDVLIDDFRWMKWWLVVVDFC
jgi:hypothetical protein